MTAKPIKMLELHYPMIQFLVILDSLPLKTTEKRQRWSNATFNNREQHSFFIVAHQFSFGTLLKFYLILKGTIFYQELNNATARPIVIQRNSSAFSNWTKTCHVLL